MDHLSILTAIEPIEQAWSALAQETGASMFLWPGWILAWWNAYGAGDLEVHTAWRDDRLVGVVPLERRGGSLTSTADWRSPWSGPVALDAEAASSLARLAADERPSRIELRHLRTDDPATTWYLDALRDEGFLALPTRDEVRSPYTTLGSSWEEHESRLPKSRRSHLHRRDRRLAEAGQVSVEVHDGSHRLDDLLDEGFAVEGSGWKGREGTSINADPALRDMLSSVARWAAERGALRLIFLRLDGRPIAFNYLLAEGDAVIALKSGYDEHYRNFGPSVMTMREIIKIGIDEGARTVEWLGSADTDSYKLEWSDGSHLIRTHGLVSPTLRGRAELRARQLWRWSKPRLERARTATTTRLAAAREHRHVSKPGGPAERRGAA